MALMESQHLLRQNPVAHPDPCMKDKPLVGFNCDYIATLYSWNLNSLLCRMAKNTHNQY